MPHPLDHAHQREERVCWAEAAAAGAASSASWPDLHRWVCDTQSAPWWWGTGACLRCSISRRRVWCDSVALDPRDWGRGERHTVTCWWRSQKVPTARSMSVCVCVCVCVRVCVCEGVTHQIESVYMFSLLEFLTTNPPSFAYSDTIRQTSSFPLSPLSHPHCLTSSFKMSSALVRERVGKNHSSPSIVCPTFFT